MSTQKNNFWQQKTLQEMSAVEWESLCDGCAKCCLHKLEDEDTEQVLYTRVACQYLDEQCRCRQYPRRTELAELCLNLRAEDVAAFHWLPLSCAYRLVAEGKPLYDWHPLLSGDKQSVHRAGMSVKGKVLSEEHVHVDGFEEHIVHWVDALN